MKSNDVLNIRPELPDAGRLFALLKEWRRRESRIHMAESDFAGKKADLEEVLHEIDPSDSDAIGRLSALQTQVELFPATIERHREKLRTECIAPLVQAATQFEDELKAALDVLADKRRKAIATDLKRYFPEEVVFGGATGRTRADDFAAQAKPVWDVESLRERVDASRHEEAATMPDWEEALPKAVGELLALADQAARL